MSSCMSNSYGSLMLFIKWFNCTRKDIKKLKYTFIINNFAVTVQLLVQHNLYIVRKT